MPSDYSNSPEAQAEALAWSIKQDITAFIADHPGVNLQTLSEMLGATKFLKLIPSKSKDSSPVWHLEVSAFVEELKAQHRLHAIKMPQAMENTHDTILPPDPGEIATGSGQGIEKKAIIPRTRYLIEVLTELHLSYSVHEGQNTPNMLRQLSYQVFEVPEKGLVILVNNEEGNATFIIHHTDENNPTNNWKYFSQLTKDQLKASGQDKVTVVLFNKSVEEWKREIAYIIVDGPTEKEPHKPTSHPGDGVKFEYKYRTVESALEELEEAFKKWRTLPEETGARFNFAWLENNGFGGLTNWCKRKTSDGRIAHMPLGALVDRSTNENLKKSFEKQGFAYTEAGASAKLEEAFKKWQALPEKTRGKFNTFWIWNNGFNVLANWCRRKTPDGKAVNLSLEDIVDRSTNENLKKSFKRQEHKQPYTETTALARLEEAFKKWRTLPEKTRGKFNSLWLDYNGFGGLLRWCRRKTPDGKAMNISLYDLVARSTNAELKKSFKKR